MKPGMLIALLALAGGAAAEEPQPAPERGFAWVSGKENPHAIPEWSALDSMLGAAVRSDNGKELLKTLTNVSESAALALLEYRRAQEIEMKAGDAASYAQHRAALCNRTTSKEQVIAERHRVAEEHQARRRASVEGAYTVLGTEDAAKLRTAVRAARSNVTSLGVSDPTKAYEETINYLSALCVAVLLNLSESTLRRAGRKCLLRGGFLSHLPVPRLHRRIRHGEMAVTRSHGVGWSAEQRLRGLQPAR